MMNFFPLRGYFNLVSYRHYCSWTSRKIRDAFKSYYIENDHVYIPSSPIIPWNDFSLSFVNSGMNQFKPLFYGNLEAYFGDEEPVVRRAVNSQKCIRVGGKHNDLLDVGRDGHHHTFFEMLGSWSFDDYFKKEACQMAWDLLTNIFKIPSDHLFVTYFKGDKILGIAPDDEVKDIWRSIGVPPDQIIACGAKDNFWEMGVDGPCGPSTEIHYSYKPLRGSSANDTSSYSSSFVEIWNLVFMQYNRLNDGTLAPLASFHVDTGMGLERMTAVLNNKLSNYDTDLFLPIFKCIEKMSKLEPYKGTFNSNSLDYFYRVTADHSRMICVALADGCLPYDSYILRKILRKTLLIGREEFGLKEKYWMKDLMSCVVECLGDTYPELERKLANVHCLMEHEEDLFDLLQSQISEKWQKILKKHPALNSLTATASLNLIDGLNEILSKAMSDNMLSVDDALKLNTKYYIPSQQIEEISCVLGLDFNVSEFNVRRNEDSPKTVSSYTTSRAICNKLKNAGIKTTHYRPYNYYFDDSKKTYIFPPEEAKIVGILSKDAMENVVNIGDRVGIVTDSTNFYINSGGQTSDRGSIKGKESAFLVEKVVKYNDYIVHYGKVTEGSFRAGDEVRLYVKNNERILTSGHHTTCHLLHAALRNEVGTLYQRSCGITKDGFTLNVLSHPPLTVSNIASAEKNVQEWIKCGCPINRKTLPLSKALRNPTLSLVVGAKYPNSVHMLTSTFAEENIQSTELCCGTHLSNTSHIKDFAITDVKHISYGITKIHGVCATLASNLNSKSEEFLERINQCQNQLDEKLKNNEKIRGLEKSFLHWKKNIKKSSLPFTVYDSGMTKIESIQEIFDSVLKRKSNWQEIQKEYNELVKNMPEGPIIHKMKVEYTGPQSNLENILLENPHIPSFFVCRGWGYVRIAALLPLSHVTENFSLEDLFKKLIEGCDKGHASVRNEDVCQIGNIFMNGVKVNQVDDILNTVMDISRVYYSRI